MLTIEGLDIAFEEDKSTKIKKAKWKSMQKKAASQIRLVLTHEVYMLTEMTPSSVWKKLERVYASKSLTNWLLLKMDLYTLMIEEEVKLYNVGGWRESLTST